MSRGVSALTENLECLLTEALPSNTILMHLLMRAQTCEEAACALAAVRQRSEQGHTEIRSEQIVEIEKLWRDHPAAWALVQSVVLDHEPAFGTAEDGIAYWSARYDEIARRATEASVALYSLGDPDLLSAATAEITTFLRARDLVGPDRTILDLGCGIGRLSQALASDVFFIEAIDVSSEMIRHASQRCATLPNVRVSKCSGTDLSCFASETFDLILAVDVFPYLCRSGRELVEHHFKEAKRLLTKIGKLAIFNFDYGIDLATQRTDTARLADIAGLIALENGNRPFKLWDAAAFVFERKRLPHSAARPA